MTSAERFRRIEEIFLAALELEEGERGSYLDRECPAEDPSLRSEVEGMLAAAAEETTGDELLDGVVAAGAFAALDAEDKGPPERIGPYRILRELGRGGLATVYLAERDDEFSQRVAVKLVRRGMDTEEILERLRLERQILARLDHPNIGRLYDGGTDIDGQPYFVMEAIEGERLDLWCDSRKLPLTQRLELFVKVCGAVQEAHRSLILHRDLKPSNILVTTEGEPKLLDFGIAKVLDPEPGADVRAGFLDTPALDTPTLTQPGTRLLTPEFASPEQVRAEPLSTASDVYSLGVLLYLLVTGKRPYELDRTRPAEVERVVCEVEPERPSLVARSEPARAAPQWKPPARGDDLDNIVLMALRKEPERRYGSAAALAEDLRRYLADMPVHARRDTAFYRTGKFVRRHRWAVAAAAFLAAVLVTATAVTTWQARVARAERAEAVAQRARAEAVADFLVDVFELSDPYETLGETMPVRQVLDQSARRIRGELAADPVLRATLLATMGRVYRNLSLFDTSAALLEESLEERRGVLGDRHPEVAEILYELAMLDLDRQDPATARERLTQVLEIRRSLPGSTDGTVAETLHQLGRATAGLGDFAAADTTFDQALELFTAAGDDLGRAAVLNAMGEAWLLRDPVRAESLLRRALALRRRLHGDFHPELARILNNLAVARTNQSDSDNALALQQEALEISGHVFGERSLHVSTMTVNLAWTRFSRGENDEAQALFEHALELRHELYGEDHPAAAGVLVGLTRIEQARGRLAEEAGRPTVATARRARAMELARQAWEIHRQSFGSDHPTALWSFYVWADAARLAQDPQAEALFAENIERLRGRPEQRIRLAESLLGLGQTRLDHGRYAAAEEPLREALAGLREIHGEDYWVTGIANGELGRCLAALGRSREATARLSAGVAALEATLGVQSHHVRRLKKALAEVPEPF